MWKHQKPTMLRRPGKWLRFFCTSPSASPFGVSPLHFAPRSRQIWDINRIQCISTYHQYITMSLFNASLNVHLRCAYWLGNVVFGIDVSCLHWEVHHSREFTSQSTLLQNVFCSSCAKRSAWQCALELLGTARTEIWDGFYTGFTWVLLCLPLSLHCERARLLGICEMMWVLSNVDWRIVGRVSYKRPCFVVHAVQPFLKNTVLSSTSVLPKSSTVWTKNLCRLVSKVLEFISAW